jgi:NTP pyrophosphatase (non-canonical NTP hydrolase)
MTSLAQMQQQVDTWINSIGIRYFSEMTQLAQLTEEVGEVARIISRTYGEQSYKQGAEQGDLADELADVLFVITCLANKTGINLQEAFDKNMAKKTKRDATRHAANEKLK